VHRIPKILSALVAVLLLAVAAALVVVLFEMIDVLDEGLMHTMTAAFESEPKEGWDYWRWKAIKEALPGWIMAGAIWLSLFVPIVYIAYRHGRNILSRDTKS
jgi:hypothetical protein